MKTSSSTGVSGGRTRTLNLGGNNATLGIEPGYTWRDYEVRVSMFLDCPYRSWGCPPTSIRDKGLSEGEVGEMRVRKPGELTDTEKNTLKIEIRAGCRNMGANSIYLAPGQKVRIHDRESFGLCADCGHFGFMATQYKIKMAVCERADNFLIRLSEDEPIVECTSYYTRDEQDAHDYSKNAWLLDPAEKKVGII